MEEEPEATTKRAYDRFFRATPAARAKLDTWYLPAASDDQAANLNTVQDLYNLTPVGSPDFVAGQGYAGNSTPSYLDSGFNPTTAASPKFTRNSASMFLWSLTDTDNPGASASQDMGNTNSAIVRAATGGVVCRTNTSSTSTAAAQLQMAGLVGWTRPDASNVLTYQNGEFSATNAQASAAPTSANFWLCGRAPSNYGSNRLSIGGWGQHLSADDWNTIYIASLTYLADIGVFGEEYMFMDSTFITENSLIITGGA